MLSSQIRAKYFAELSGRYLQKQQWGTLSVVLFSSADAASFLASLPPQLLSVRLLLAVAASIYLTLAQNGRKAIEANELYARSEQVTHRL